MMRIFIVRHALAQDKGEALPDFERSLVKKGEKEAVAVARHLASRQAPPDLMLSSFANRAIETAHLFAKAFRYPRQRIVLRDTFYGDIRTEDLMNEIRKQPDKYQSLMLFGHDPAFSQLAAYLIKDFHEVLPKAGVVVAEFPIKRWRDLEGASGRLAEFTGPALIKEQKKHTRNDLEERLARSMGEIMASINKAGARAFRKETRRSARRVAKGFMKALEELAPAPVRKLRRGPA